MDVACLRVRGGGTPGTHPPATRGVLCPGGRHPGDSPAGHMRGPGVENQSQQTREPLPTGAGPEPFLQEAEGTMGSLWETSHWP